MSASSGAVLSAPILALSTPSIESRPGCRLSRLRSAGSRRLRPNGADLVPARTGLAVSENYCLSNATAPKPDKGLETITLPLDPERKPSSSAARCRCTRASLVDRT